jgi:hypothetical protein
MNQIIHEDFGLFKDELLSVNFINWNLNSHWDLSRLASYFQCYQKMREENKYHKEVNNQNKYELTFINDIVYWNEIQAHFAGFHANYFLQVNQRRSPFQ